MILSDNTVILKWFRCDLWDYDRQYSDSPVLSMRFKQLWVTVPWFLSDSSDFERQYMHCQRQCCASKLIQAILSNDTTRSMWSSRILIDSTRMCKWLKRFWVTAQWGQGSWSDFERQYNDFNIRLQRFWLTLQWLNKKSKRCWVMVQWFWTTVQWCWSEVISSDRTTFFKWFERFRATVRTMIWSAVDAM